MLHDLLYLHKRIIVKMGKISIIRVDEASKKKKIMKDCDAAFAIRLFDRVNAEEIVNRIVRFAEFYAAVVTEESELDEGSTVGYVAFYANDDKGYNAYITSIGVIEGYRKQHVGSSLLKTALATSVSKGMKRIRLEVLNTNHEAIRFYKNWGFEFEGGSGQAECNGSSYMVRMLTKTDRGVFA